ncbi:MAG: 5-formyltetrahydrofolate cyclo-ligase [Coprobacillaceae bacterium]
MDKQAVRKEMIKKRLDLDMTSYMSKSNLIIYNLEKLNCFNQAKTIGVYVSMKQEVNTIEFIKKWCKSKRIVVPKVNGKKMNFYHIYTMNDLEAGNFGVLEPKSNILVKPSEIDLLIIPIVAYTNEHHRIGYGGGYYDRYLQDYNGLKIGIAFSFQKILDFEIENHDIPLDTIINENSSTII